MITVEERVCQMTPIIVLIFCQRMTQSGEHFLLQVGDSITENVSAVSGNDMMYDDNDCGGGGKKNSISL